MKNCILFLTVALSPAFGIGLSTGTAPWLVNGNPAVVETVIPTNWVPNTGPGLWVGTTASDGDPNAGAPAGTYVYTLAIGALLGGAGVFTMDFAADNSVVWSITNGTIDVTSASCSGNCFSTLLTMTGTLSATSVLTGTVTNTTAGATGLIANSPGLASSSATATNPTGLFVSGTANAVPEPSTYAMLLLSGACLIARRMRRVRCVDTRGCVPARSPGEPCISMRG